MDFEKYVEPKYKQKILNEDESKKSEKDEGWIDMPDFDEKKVLETESPQVASNLQIFDD